MADQMKLFEAPEPIRRDGGIRGKPATSHVRRGPRWLNQKVVARMTPEEREEQKGRIKPEGQGNG